PEQVRGYCGNGAQWSLRIRYSQEPRLMGTAGAIKKVEHLLSDGPFVVLSGDGLHDVDLSALYAFHRQKKSMATMVLKAIDARFEYGVTMADGDGRITRFLEKPSWGDVFSNKVNTGIYLFEPEINASYDFGHELWPKLLRLKKPIYAWEWKGYWCDVGNLSEYRRAQADSLTGQVGINIPPGAVLKAPCVIGKGSVIDDGCVIGPCTVIGERARISPKAVLKNCIIGSEGHINEDITVYEAAVLNIRQ
ncbi:MAG: mannose-1-phosphate guanylyltransferase, partial [Elusimicrobia bacterium]